MIFFSYAVETILSDFSVSYLILFIFFATQGNLRHWMEEPDCRDQYSVIYDSGEKTGIFSNDVKEPIEVEERAVRNYIKFSPS